MRGLPKNAWDPKRGIFHAPVSEESVVVEITARLWFQARIKVWRIRERIPGQSKNLSTPGISDLIGFVPLQKMIMHQIRGDIRHALPLFIEVKRPGGKHRPAQEAFIQEAKEGGCIAFFAEKWLDVVTELAKWGICLEKD